MYIIVKLYHVSFSRKLYNANVVFFGWFENKSFVSSVIFISTIYPTISISIDGINCTTCVGIFNVWMGMTVDVGGLIGKVVRIFTGIFNKTIHKLLVVFAINVQQKISVFLRGRRGQNTLQKDTVKYLMRMIKRLLNRRK